MAEAIRVSLERMRQFHVKSSAGAWCTTCLCDWPCDVAKLLEVVRDAGCGCGQAHYCQSEIDKLKRDLLNLCETMDLTLKQGRGDMLRNHVKTFMKTFRVTIRGFK